MICLLKNCASVSIPDYLPPDTYISPSADVARIKYYREIINRDIDKIDSTYFNVAWTDISNVCNLQLQDKEIQNTFSLKLGSGWAGMRFIKII